MEHAGGALAPVSLFMTFANVPDPRGRTGRRFSVAAILAVVSAAVASGALSLRAVAQWARTRSKAELIQLGVFRGEAPSEAAIRFLLHRLDAAALDQATYDFLRRLCGGLAGKPIALDGKTVRGARDDRTPAPHLVSAVLHDEAVTVGQVQVDLKSNEIGALPKLLEQLDAPGAVFTVDAMHTQVATAEQIVSGKNADYLMTVKANQPNLLDAIATNPWLAVSPCGSDD